MFDLRALLIRIAVPAGLALGALGWLGLAAFGLPGRGVVAAEAAAGGARLGGRAARTASAPLAALNASPLFALATGPHPAADPAVRLDGLARFGGQQSALISVDGKPAEWLARGATRDGVTLIEVRGGRALLDTALGFKEVALGQTSGAAGAASSGSGPGAPALASSGGDRPPPGVRLPPPPASAPPGGG